MAPNFMEICRFRWPVDLTKTERLEENVGINFQMLFALQTSNSSPRVVCSQLLAFVRLGIWITEELWHV